MYTIQLTNLQLNNFINDLISINKYLSTKISNNDYKKLESYLPTEHIKKIKKEFILFNLDNKNIKKKKENFIILLVKCIVLIILSKNTSYDYNIILNQLDSKLKNNIINDANNIIKKISPDVPDAPDAPDAPDVPVAPIAPIVPDAQVSPDTPDSFNIIKIIDEYIESFSLDQLLVKPDFILDKNKLNKNSNIIVRNIIDKTKSDIILQDNNDYDYDYDYTNIDKTKSNIRLQDNNDYDYDYDYDYTNINKTKLSGMEKFNQKKIFFDIITSFISKTLLENEHALIFNFQYLVNNFFNKNLEKYIKKNNYNERDIFFIYKGGTTMKILYEKYNKIFDASSDLFNKLHDMFSRSDSDYGLYITKDFNQEIYDNVFYDLFIITYNILNKIKLFLNDNRYTNYILPLNKEKHINKNNVLNVIGKMNETLNNNNNLKLFENVEKFIAITINDETYISDSDNQQFLQDVKTKDFKTYYLNGIDSSPNLNSRFSLNNTSKRKDFYITWNDETKINSSRKIGYINETTNNIFHTINDNIYFKVGDTSMVSIFSLQRIKLNTILYFKMKGSNTYGRMNCPSELIDISLASFKDFKNNLINLNEDIKMYTYKDTLNTNKDVKFFSYTLPGFIDDILMAFVEKNLLWEIIKYEKKINRIILLLCVYLYNEKKIEIISSIINIINELLTNNSSNLDNIKNKINIINDKLVKELLTIILNNKLIVNNTNNNEYTQQFKKLSAFIIDTFKIFLNDLKKISPDINTGYHDIPESIPYLKKYLKYKQKYLDLLKKN
jgi:hypothetical protein